MKSSKLILTLAASLLLVGAGCGSNAPTNTNSTPVDLSQALPDKAEVSSVPVTTTTAIDATWKTYTNKDLGFSFQWPTKGRYAPLWSVSFAKDGEEKMKDGCVSATGSSNHITVGESVFCHTSLDIKDGMSTDYYATKVGETNVVLTFKKKVPEKDTEFTAEGYEAALDQIVSTFRVTK